MEHQRKKSPSFVLALPIRFSPILLTMHMHLWGFTLHGIPPCPAQCCPCWYHSFTLYSGIPCRRPRLLNLTRMCSHHQAHLYPLKPQPWTIQCILASSEPLVPWRCTVLCTRPGIMDWSTEGQFGDHASGQRRKSFTADPAPGQIGTPLIHMSSTSAVSRQVSHKSAITPLASYFI